jgi:hypothetical protein
MQGQDQEADQVSRRTIHVALLSAEGIRDRRICHCDRGRAIWGRMGACPGADRKDTIRCLFRTTARVFKCDVALRQRCSNIVQAVVADEAMEQERHGQPIADRWYHSAERRMPPWAQRLCCGGEARNFQPGVKSLPYLLTVDKGPVRTKLNPAAK